MLRSRLLAGSGLVVVVLALCSPMTAGGVASASARARADLPPASRKALVAIFDRRVEPLGLRVTRAALVNARQERDRSGTHLAIYVEPTDEYTSQEYVDGVVDVSRVFLPSVFARWKGLQSFDVCQEPRPSVDDSKAPSPKTQVFATRAGSKLVDWSTVDIATLVAESDAEAAAAGNRRPARLSLFVAQHLRSTPAYRQAVPTTAPPVSTTPTIRGY